MSDVITSEDVRAFRSQFGLSQEDLGRETDCSQSQISKVELGTIEVPSKISGYIKRRRRDSLMKGGRPVLREVSIRRSRIRMRIMPQQHLKVSIDDAGESIEKSIAVAIPKGLEVDDPLVEQLVINAITAATNLVLPIGFDQGVKRVASVVRDLAVSIENA